MDKYYIAVVGTGETSRANVEALIEDYVYGHGQDVVFILPYLNKPSQGQIFTAQFAKDKGKEIVIFCNEGAQYEGLPTSSVYHNDNPYKALLSKFDKEELKVFVLPEKEDNLENNDVFLEFESLPIIDLLDLTEGLIPYTLPGEAPEELEEDSPKVEITNEDPLEVEVTISSTALRELIREIVQEELAKRDSQDASNRASKGE